MIVQEAKEEKKKRRLKKGLVVFVSGEFCFVTQFSPIIPEFCRAGLGCMVSSLVNYVTFLSMKK